MIRTPTTRRTLRDHDPVFPQDEQPEEALLEEIDRLREENRRLAISLGGFSAFMASRGLLEDAWSHVHTIHQIDDGGDHDL